MSDQPPADRRQLLVPVASRAHPWGRVVARDPRAGQRVRCPCGTERWTAYGQAARHGRSCPVALLAQGATLQAALVAALARAGRRGAPAVVLAGQLGASTVHTRRLLRRLEAEAAARRLGRPPYRWRSA